MIDDETLTDWFEEPEKQERTRLSAPGKSPSAIMVRNICIAVAAIVIATHILIGPNHWSLYGAALAIFLCTATLIVAVGQTKKFYSDISHILKAAQGNIVKGIG